MNKILDFLTSYEIGAICNFIILIYGSILIKNILVCLYKKSQLDKLKIFWNILFLRIKENVIILLILFLLIILTYLFGDNKIINDIKTILLSTLTTILIVDSLNSFQKAQNINFELVKNIFIEKCWNIFVTLDVKEKNITNEEEIRNYYLKCPNTNLTPKINEKFEGFKTNYKDENEYFIELFKKNLSDIEMLIKFVIPNLYKIAISENFINKIEQFEFELLRLNEKYQISEIVNIPKKENSINHLLIIIQELWSFLYKEQDKFYKNQN